MGFKSFMNIFSKKNKKADKKSRSNAKAAKTAATKPTISTTVTSTPNEYTKSTANIPTRIVQSLPTPPVEQSKKPAQLNVTAQPTIIKKEALKQITPPSTPHIVKPSQTMTLQDKEDRSSNYLFSDDNKEEKLTDLNDFINTKQTNDIDLHFKNLNQHYYSCSNQSEEFLTISSAASSRLSLQDTLFSHFSTISDGQSDISSVSSDFPKITTRTELVHDDEYDQSSIFSKRKVSVVSAMGQKIFTPTLPITSTVTEYDSHFSEVYVDALKDVKTNPVKSFTLFEYIARKGFEVFGQLSTLSQLMVTFAQYRAGRTLCESIAQDDESFEQGTLYLQEASNRGHSLATFTLGFYAERKNDLDNACRLYHQAAVKGLIRAQVYFGLCVLYHPINGFCLEDGLKMLEEASSKDHSVASLSLALYYEKIGRLGLAAEYCNKVDLPESSPLYCVCVYQMGLIYLKAGSDYETTAFRYIASSAKATYYDEHGEPTKFTASLRTLGVMSMLGIGAPKNVTAAFNCVLEAAKLGDEPANILLGQMYLMGCGCTVDKSKAMQIFINYDSNVAAKLSLGLLIMNTNPEHAYKTFVEVIQFSPSSFDTEHWNVNSIKHEAQLHIALYEYNGTGGAQRNPLRAFETLSVLANKHKFSGAYYWLACAYNNGIQVDNTVIVDKNADLAFAYFLKGANASVVSCQYRVGVMLQKGYTNTQFGPQDALKFFKAAAEQDHVSALTQVGVYYFKGGVGTEHGRDKKRAFEYFTRASKYNDPLAIQYLADFIITETDIGPIDRYKVYTELNRAAGDNKDPVAYRMLALIIQFGMDPTETYETPRDSVVYPDLERIYFEAKHDAEDRRDISSRFVMSCLWKAIELHDHASGQYLNELYPEMTDDDVVKTIDLFEKVEPGVPNKLSLAYAQFLKTAKKKSNALQKFFEVASFNEVTTSIGWDSRLEAAKLILFESQGKARSKNSIYVWLQEMVACTGNNLFLPFVFLGKSHEDDICSGCQKDLALQHYESALKCKLGNVSIQAFTRMRLVEIYYKSNKYTLAHSQLKEMEPLLDRIDVSERRPFTADYYYYQGILALHNGTIYNYREKARTCLTKSDQLGHPNACIELAYLYGTTEGKEAEADAFFHKADKSKDTPFSLSGRMTESMVDSRIQHIRSSNDYLVEINEMKLAAGISYSYYNMDRQALDWFQEISDNPLAQIMILYYKMKDVSFQTLACINKMSELVGRYETASLNYYGRMVLSYGYFCLGQCFEQKADGNEKALDYYQRAFVYLQNNETYERLAEISRQNGSEDKDLFTNLINTTRNDPAAIFKLAQYYHKDKSQVASKKAADHYYKAAQTGHPEACYYYAMYRIDQKLRSSPMNAAVHSKTAASYLRIAANKNHGPSYYELGKLELAAGLYEEGIEDLKEADYLKCGDASYELGEIYRTGFVGKISEKTKLKINVNFKTARKYYRRAVKQENMMAMIQLGRFAETGAFGETDLQEARTCYMKALESRDEHVSGAAEYALGCLDETCYSISSSNDYRKSAFNWFKKAQEKNNKSAVFKIGYYLLNKLVDGANATTGLDMLMQESGEGNVEAMKELARYFESQGESAKALQYWGNAAELLNDPEALEFMAGCFESGLLGQKVDLNESRAYNERAMEARKQAVEMQRSMTGFKSDNSEERR